MDCEEDFELDQNNQFLDPDLRLNTEWLLYDHWSLDLAITLISIGCDIATYESTFDVCCDWQVRLRLARNKCKRIALTSISAGLINDPDTPANWITWAKNKGYSTRHLEQQSTPQTVEIASDAPVKVEPAKPSATVTDYAALPDDKIINSKGVMQWLDFCRMTLNRRIKDEPLFPKPFKDGNLNKWEVKSIKQYIADCKNKGMKP